MTRAFNQRDAERLERRYANPSIVEQRRVTLALLAPAPGERVLDVGSGPGYFAADLADAVGPRGLVCGVDASEAMIAMGRARCVERPWVRFERGDACALPFEDGAFDAATGTQIYLYVPDLARAFGELRRVLRPGGRVLILDTDWSAAIWNSADAALTERIMASWRARYHNPHAARVIPGALRAAGFDLVQATVYPIVETELRADNYGGGQIEETAEHAAKVGAVTPAEAQAWRDDLVARDARGEFFFSFNRYLFLARPRD